ncbi:ABC transporter ATP-binding protein [Candidatus Foliamicus sp.]
MTEVLSAENLGMSVSSPEGELEILKDINLRLKSGESCALMGPSGAGKTTLLALLAGLDHPTSGRVVLCGQDLSRLDEDGRARLRGRKLGFVFQSFHLVESLTAIENVMLPLELNGSRGARKAAEAALERVGLTQRRRHYPRHLSGGERQRVAIARAFVTDPQVLMADEPTGNLDADTGRRVGDILFEMNAQAGATLLLATHDERLARRCDHIRRLEAGRM